MAIGQWLILCMLELTIYLVLKPSGLNNSVLENMIMLVISAILWLYYFVIGKRLEQTLFQLPIKIWYLLDCIMLILTAMMEFFSYVIVEELPEGRVTGAGELLVISGGSLICILLLAMIYYYNRTQNFRLQKELAEIQNEQQREYFQQLLKKEEETRCFRHDIINDLLELQNYCEQQEYDKLKLYLKDTLGIVEDISKSSYDVGNDIINTVINYYLSPIKEKYDVEVDGYIDENILIEQRDLCIVSANLVKNAVEAVKKLESGEIRIRVSKGERYFSIKVENDFEGNLTWGKNGLPVTTKEIKNNHGIGLRNVNEVIRKYDGRY
ncbi:MAG: sensor histidine kinase, partial [Lachnospiraceae bacterium]